MSDDQFRQMEDQFFALKGQLATGRITQEQFEAALKNMMVQGAEGRYWMIGADTGKWYVHDGQTWVEAVPSMNSTPSAPSSVVEPTKAPSTRSNSKIFIALGLVVMLCISCGAVLFLTINLGFINIGPTIPTTQPFPIVTLPSAPTNPPSTAIFVPTVPAVPSIQPTITLLPTVPFAPTSRPTNSPTSTATLRPVVPTTAPTSTPAVAPGLYVTNIRPDPLNLPPGMDISFYVTFLNATGGVAHNKWRVYIFKPDNLRNSFGDTSTMNADIPVGSSEQKVSAWRISQGACGEYLARAGWIDDNNRVTFFTKPDGQTYELDLVTCR